jgi:hypothetical protein
MRASLPPPDAAIAARECNRGMDSFDTWPLIAAPVLGLAMVVMTVIATLIAG